MKKSSTIIFLFVILIASFYGCNSQQNTFDKKIAAENNSYIVYEEVVFNEELNVNSIQLTIVEISTNKELFKTIPCRAYDYHGVYFLQESNDFIVKSSDTGDLKYEFNGQNNSWDCIEN